MKFHKDQRPAKDAMVEIINELPKNATQEEADLCLEQVMYQAQNVSTNHEGLRNIIRSQIMSGNKKGAIKVIALLKDKQTKLLPTILFGFLLWPIRFAVNLIALGFK